MEYYVIEEISPKPDCKFKDELIRLIQDESLFVFPVLDEETRYRSFNLDSIQYLRKIFILFVSMSDN